MLRSKQICCPDIPIQTPLRKPLRNRRTPRILHLIVVPPLYDQAMIALILCHKWQRTSQRVSCSIVMLVQFVIDHDRDPVGNWAQFKHQWAFRILPRIGTRGITCWIMIPALPVRRNERKRTSMWQRANSWSLVFLFAPNGELISSKTTLLISDLLISSKAWS